jgi:hypothetical protein
MTWTCSGLTCRPPFCWGADEVIEQDARARKLKLSRSQLGTWTKDSFGSKRAVPLISSERQIYLSKRTRRAAVGASGLGQQRTHAAQRDTGVLSDPVPRCVRPRFCDGAPIDYRGLQSCADNHDRVKRYPGDQGWRGRRSITSTAVYTTLALNRFRDFLRRRMMMAGCRFTCVGGAALRHRKPGWRT